MQPINSQVLALTFASDDAVYAGGFFYKVNGVVTAPPVASNCRNQQLSLVFSFSNWTHPNATCRLSPLQNVAFFVIPPFRRSWWSGGGWADRYRAHTGI